MRKKTIEEELMEIHDEKDEHIEKLNDEYLSSSDNHAYNFNSVDKKEKKKEESSVQFETDISEKSLAELDKAYSEGKFDPSPKTKTKHAKVRNNHTPVFVLIFAGLIFFCAGLGVSIFAGIRPWIISSTYIPVQATVIDVDYHYDSDGDLMGSPIYEYYVDDVRYVQKSPVSSSSNICPQIGEIVTIKYNPKNPTEIYTDGWIHIVLTFFGVPFVAVGVFLFVLSAKEIKKRNAAKNMS